MIRCPECGRERFILPRSPLAGITETAATSGRRASSAALWLLPLASVIVTVATLGLVYWFFLAPQPKRTAGDDDIGKKSAAERLQQARRFLADGMFRLAADELSGEPDELPPEERRHWRQLKRESALLADLCSEPLEEILHHAAGVPEREWQADFRHRYQGKAIVFDTIVRQTANGKPRGTYIFPGPDRVHLELGDLELFRRLPLDQPRRMLFGARLASVRLKPPGTAWEVRFEAESGVVLTDAKAAGLVCPAFNEPDALRVLEDQAKIALQQHP